MERHATSAELKARAKGQLLGKYGTVIPAVLAVEIIMLSISGVISFPLNPQTIPGAIGSFIVECLMQLLGGIFIAGQTYLYLNISCGGNIRVSDVFYGFTHHPDRAILIQLLQLLLMLAAYVPLFVVLGLWMVIDSIYMLIPVAVTFCFGLIVSVIISLMYSQSYFVMLDFPDFTALQCLRYSRRIMKGSKARRFYLDMSFIPLYLLGLLTCCIGLLFVIPYVNTTYSNFYLELMSKRNGQ
ncbi:MAG TPA: DUF975 family protein [Candidatus Eisenbergiella pullistercoris]|uniref:DUF975 family protein n=1 Tax=Candidatus Eisenbergiella pullistercoris TaxID=2838555 RepID=A0A9D1YPZ0_9FIRM|nr:DUF975 family protein [Candidatus Eisenbergiella pullistercoris]